MKKKSRTAGFYKLNPIGKAEVKKVKAISSTELELNKWCIEMAIRWPTITEWRNNANYQGGIGSLPNVYGTMPMARDVDLILRATMIKKWVTAKS